MIKCFFENEDGPCWGNINALDEDGEGNSVDMCEAHAEYDFRRVDQPERYKKKPPNRGG